MILHKKLKKINSHIVMENWNYFVGFKNFHDFKSFLNFFSLSLFRCVLQHTYGVIGPSWGGGIGARTHQAVAHPHTTTQWLAPWRSNYHQRINHRRRSLRLRWGKHWTSCSLHHHHHLRGQQSQCFHHHHLLHQPLCLLRWLPGLPVDLRRSSIWATKMLGNWTPTERHLQRPAAEIRQNQRSHSRKPDDAHHQSVERTVPHHPGVANKNASRFFINFIYWPQINIYSF